MDWHYLEYMVWLLKFVTHEEGIVFCLDPLFNVTPIGENCHNTIEKSFFANLCESWRKPYTI